MAVELREGALVLRPWREDDAEAVHAACQDPEILRWMPGIPRPYTLEDALAFVTGRVDLGPYQLAITEAGRVLGSIGMIVDEQRNTAQIGYWCVRDARGRGVTTSALRALCRHALETMTIERVELITDPDNHASQRVAQKVGFRREGVLRSHLVHPDGRRRDSVMFSLLPGELQ